MFPLECIIDNLYYMEKVSPLISVIIPVYKVELYLKQCVESILIQTYSNIEIILVDDGSPDKCGQIIDEYKEKDSRIISLHKKNGGLSDARNVGLNGAVGQYVVFVDSDDYWLNENCLKSLVDEINRTPNIDFICFNSYSFVNGTIKNDWIAYSDNILNAQDNNSLINSLIKSGTVPMAAWSKIIRRSFLLEKGYLHLLQILFLKNHLMIYFLFSEMKFCVSIKIFIQKRYKMLCCHLWRMSFVFFCLS